ncbi:MAG: ferritin [Spirochaetes bacterium]|nr:MAG: ferritin [Spirochaetota bacterium]
MLSKRMEEALNKQINAELYSAYLYLSMAAYFDSISLDGFSHWMKLQAKEETEHAYKIYGYVYERGGSVILEAINKPPTKWDSPLAVFEDAYKHEQKVSEMINNLVAMAREEKDYATENFLQWFVEEQVEEEANADEVVQKLKMVKDSRNGLFMMDGKLGQRK